MSQPITSEPRAQRQVDTSYSGLVSSVNALETELDNLAKRLSPVLSPAPSQKGDSGSGPRPIKAQLATQIDQESDRIGGVSQSIRELLDRLEL